MIKNPKNGWCEFQIGDKKFDLSYLTNVPVDLLDCFIRFYTFGCSACYFDLEGSEITLVLNPDTVYIIEQADDTRVYNMSPVKEDKTDLAAELIQDIETYRNGWDEWDTLPLPEIKTQQHNLIEEKLRALKTILRKGGDKHVDSGT